MEILLCERVNDLRHSLFHLLNCLNFWNSPAVPTKSKQMTELFEIELFDYLTVYKQMTDVLLNC